MKQENLSYERPRTYNGDQRTVEQWNSGNGKNINELFEIADRQEKIISETEEAIDRMQVKIDKVFQNALGYKGKV